MLDLATLRDDCALMVHDPSFAEITALQWITFLRSASLDARNMGWLVDHEDDESITVVATTYDYTVPQAFAYVDRLILSESINGTTQYLEPVPHNQWEIRLNGGVPQFTFATLTSLSTGHTVKVIGQKRPTIYTSADEPIDAGMESFLRERALYFAFRYMGAGSSELANWRRTMSSQSFQTSDMMLRRHPQEFRMRPNAEAVPGRA